MTPFATVKDTLKRLKPLLADKYHVSSIGLFGSIVRDDFSAGSSDIDIIVDFSKPIGIEFVDLANYLEKSLNGKVDLVSRKGVKSKYFLQIEPEIVYV
jgi:predicted nucleotidyltransferase